MTSAEVARGLGARTALSMYRTMVQIREFEEQIRSLFLQGKMPGTVHQYIGQEACAVGVSHALGEGDVVASTHRPHGHAIASGIPMGEVAAELYGKTEGCCRGKGGSMHVGDPARGMLPAIAIVGGNIPIITGVALSFKLRKKQNVAVSFFGDGASNEGAFHEGLNAAAVYEVPAVFVCENNLYGASTSVTRVMKVENVADRACAYGMESAIADGMDVFAVYHAAKARIEAARSGKGPSLLELKTFRLCGHSRRDPNNYMSDEEKAEWRKKDPIPACEKILRDEELVTTDELSEVKEAVAREVEEAILFGREGTDPDPEDLYEGLYTSMEVPR